MSYNISEVAERIETTTEQDLIELIDASVESQLSAQAADKFDARLLLALVGECGTGKTQFLTHTYRKAKEARGSKALGLDHPIKVLVKVFTGSQDAAEELGGMWIPNRDSKKMERYLPEEALGYFDGCEDYDLIICFWDELANCSPPMLSAVQSYFEDGQIRGRKMAPNAVSIAAWNLPEHSSNANKMPDSFTTGRFCIVLWGVDHKRWVRWAIANDVDPRIIMAIEQRPELLFVKKDRRSQEMVEARPRAYEKLDIAIKQGLTGRSLDIVGRGLLGNQGWATVKGYFELGDELPTMDEILDDPKGAVVPGKGKNSPEQGPAAQWVISSNIASWVKVMGEELTPTEAGAFLTYLDRLTGEMAAWGARMCESVNKEFCNAKGWGAFQKKHSSLMYNTEV